MSAENEQEREKRFINSTALNRCLPSDLTFTEYSDPERQEELLSDLDPPVEEDLLLLARALVVPRRLELVERRLLPPPMNSMRARAAGTKTTTPNLGARSLICFCQICLFCQGFFYVFREMITGFWMPLIASLT